MEELRRIKRESTSPLAPIMQAKSVDDLIDMFMSPGSSSEESTEALDEVIRRAVLYTEARERGAQLVKDFQEKGHTGKAKVLAPDPSSKGH